MTESFWREQEAKKEEKHLTNVRSQFSSADLDYEYLDEEDEVYEDAFSEDLDDL